MCIRDRDCPYWTVPYLPIDPNDVGRTYESNVIRINSQSGKGGVGYILQQKYGINMPAKMKEEMGYLAKSVSDANHKELSPEWIYNIFRQAYVDHTPIFTVDEWHYKQIEGGIETELYVCRDGKRIPVTGRGNGRLDSVSYTHLGPACAAGNLLPALPRDAGVELKIFIYKRSHAA